MCVHIYTYMHILNVLRDGVSQGTARLTEPVSPLDFCGNGNQKCDAKAAISVNMAMGGTATCLVFKKYTA